MEDIATDDEYGIWSQIWVWITAPLFIVHVTVGRVM